MYNIYGNNIHKGYELVARCKTENEVLSEIEIRLNKDDEYNRYLVIEKKHDRDDVYGLYHKQNNKIMIKRL